MRTDGQVLFGENENSEIIFVLCFQGVGCVLVVGVACFVRTVGSVGGMG